MEQSDILLVVDDEPAIPRLIVRSFKQHFERIVFASTPDEAESILQQNAVTHLLCDQNLGPSYRCGSEQVRRWMLRYPSLKRAVLFTGDDPLSVECDDDIRVLSKTTPPKIVLNSLKGA